MAYNEETAQRLREELETVADISEKKMFGTRSGSSGAPTSPGPCRPNKRTRLAGIIGHARR